MTKSSNPSILESCRTEYVLMVVKMSIILARRRWKVSNFPKIYISLKSNCFSFGFCFSFCFVSWKQDWYPWRPEAKSVRKAWPRIEYPLNIYTTWVQPLIRKEQDRGWGAGRNSSDFSAEGDSRIGLKIPIFACLYSYAFRHQSEPLSVLIIYSDKPLFLVQLKPVSSPWSHYFSNRITLYLSPHRSIGELKKTDRSH